MIPAGLDATVPAPRSAWFTVRTPSSLNVAVTVRAAFMDTVQVAPAEVSHPVHPVNVDPDAALAVNVTVAPLTYGSEQSAPQLMPAGLDATVPVPTSALVTPSVKSTLKVAVTVFAALMLTVQVEPETVVHPLQPVNADPEAAAAVSVTVVPLR